MNDVLKIANALKPPKCPKCGAEIDHLVYYVKELSRAKFWYVDGYSEYSNWDTIDTDAETAEYCCPECQEVLFRDEGEAEQFFSGESDGDSES
jgi:hypothetical protein